MNKIIEPIDMEELMEIMDDDKEMLRECVGEFLAWYSEIIGSIREAVESGNDNDLHQSAHKLKSSLKYLAAKPAIDIASALETMGKEKDLSAASHTLNLLEKECERLKEFIISLRSLASTV